MNIQESTKEIPQATEDVFPHSSPTFDLYVQLLMTMYGMLLQI